MSVVLRILFIVIPSMHCGNQVFLNWDISHHGGHKHSSGSVLNDYNVGSTIINKRAITFILICVTNMPAKY